MQGKRNNTGNFINRTVAELIKGLKKEELGMFKKFIEMKGSPSINKVWVVLRKSYPKLLLTDQAICRAMNPEKPMKNGAYRVLLNELSTITIAFYAEQEFKQNQKLYTNTVANALLKRNAQRTYKKIKKKNEELHFQEVNIDSDFYYFKYKKEYIDFQFMTLNEPLRFGTSLPLASKFHDYSFLTQKLRFLIAKRNRERIFKQSYPDFGEEDFLNYLITFPLSDLPLVNSYYLILLALKKPNYEVFLKFKLFFLSRRSKIEKNEARQLISLAVNICFWEIRNGNLQFLEERFELTKILVEENYLEVLGYFSHNHFRPVLRDAIEAEKLNWLYSFLMKILPKIRPEHRGNLEPLGWASYYFAKGNLDKQAKYMLKMNSKDYKFTSILNELSYRALKLKTDFVSLGNKPKNLEKKSFQGQIASILRFCERNTDKKKPNAATFKALSNFGHAIRLLFNQKYGKKRVDVDIKKEILSMDGVTEIPWLLKQINIDE